MIRYLPRQAVDIGKWNDRIMMSAEGRIYAHTTFLDKMADQWDGLVMDDYTAVMPLTWRSRVGFRYLYQPTFLQQAGVIGTYLPEHLHAFYTEASNRFRFAEIGVSLVNVQGWSIRGQENQVLRLNRPYQELSQQYSDYTRRKIQQASEHSWKYCVSLWPDMNLTAYQNLLFKRSVGLPDRTIRHLWQFATEYPRRVLIRELWIDNQLAASVLGLFHPRRICLLTLTAHDRERFGFATHVLIDSIIREFADREMVLDFEGSSLPGVHAFNSGFGASSEPYGFIRWNHLPWPIRLLKPAH